mmetsp:Transcript_29427/g.75358  ORF Transcript_29427/g.75358 Transcript_29427/m.75358 type:complete len:258 (+) Transcript_29427:2068-2841(+)
MPVVNSHVEGRGAGLWIRPVGINGKILQCHPYRLGITPVRKTVNVHRHEHALYFRIPRLQSAVIEGRVTLGIGERNVSSKSGESTHKVLVSEGRGVHESSSACRVVHCIHIRIPLQQHLATLNGRPLRSILQQWILVRIQAIRIHPKSNELLDRRRVINLQGLQRTAETIKVPPRLTAPHHHLEIRLAQLNQLHKRLALHCPRGLVGVEVAQQRLRLDCVATGQIPGPCAAVKPHPPLRVPFEKKRDRAHPILSRRV